MRLIIWNSINWNYCPHFRADLENCFGRPQFFVDHEEHHHIKCLWLHTLPKVAKYELRTREETLTLVRRRRDKSDVHVVGSSGSSPATESRGHKCVLNSSRSLNSSSTVFSASLNRATAARSALFSRSWRCSFTSAVSISGFAILIFATNVRAEIDMEYATSHGNVAILALRKCDFELFAIQKKIKAPPNS
jgi:hypothetical protein